MAARARRVAGVDHEVHDRRIELALKSGDRVLVQVTKDPVGHKGARLREIGTTAREQINRLLGTRVHLNLHVKVLKEWQRDAKYLNRLGF